MKCKQLGLRVLSTAAIMSIVSSIAMPAFAEVYYIGNGNDLTIEAKDDGYVYVNGHKDADGNITIKGGSGEDSLTKSNGTTSTTSIGESSPVTQESKTEETPVVTEEEEQPEETAEETPEEPEQEEETPAEDEVVKEAKEEPETQEQPEEKAQEEKPVETEEKADEPEETAEETQEKTEEPAAEQTEEQEEPEQPKAEEQTEEKQETQVATMEAQSTGTPVAQSDDGSDDTTSNTPVDNVISVINNWVDKILNITLDNVNIKSTGNAAMSATGKGKTTIELDGNNVLDSSGSYGHAGLEVGEGSNVTITDSDGTVNADGTVDDRATLTATGGNGGAGIGGAKDGKKVGNITINGTADVTATGSAGYYRGGSGIGTGGISSGMFPSSSVGDITIGGNALVKASGVGSAGTGIGGSYKGEVGNITITDNADVTATGVGDGAGIGSGGSSEKETNITINGNAKVDATGSTGIGSGNGSKGKVTIKLQDYAKVNATSTGSGAAIGTGGNASGGADIIIGTEGKSAEDEQVVVNAEWINAGQDSRTGVGAAIGTGGTNSSNTVLNITIQGGAIIENATTGGNGAGIGAGTIGNQANNPVSGSIVIKDSAKVVNALGYYAIGFIKGKTNTTSSLEISGNAVLENLSGYYGGIAADNITLKDNIVIKNLDNNINNWWPLIDANKELTIGNNVDITLTQPSVNKSTFIKAGKDKDGNTIYLTKNDVENIISKDGTGKITYRIKDKTTGEYTLQYIAHGENGCHWEKDESQSEASTCKKKGKLVLVCKLEDGAVNPSCTYGDNGTNTKTIELDYADHTWNDGVVTTAATCEADGVKTYTCTVCGETKTEIIQATGHAYGEWTVTTPATCTEKGEETRVCANDASHKETRELPATGHQHTHIEGQKDATDAEPGYTGDTVCDDCGTTLKKGEVLPALGHEYEEKVTKEPTCTEDGEKTFTCKRNDDSYTEKIPATGHQHTEVIGAKDPTCTEPGYTGDTVCKDCGEIVKKGEVIPATGHQHTHIEGQKDATDTEPGYTGDTVCDDCGAVIGKGESIPAKGVPADENNESVSTPELWVIAPDTIRQTFTVRQNGTERIYTSPYNSGTLTGTMEILQYLQEQGVETIVFTTNQRTSRFAVADLLALVGEGDVFYLRHMDAAEPTLLVIANDHSDLLNG